MHVCGVTFLYVRHVCLIWLHNAHTHTHTHMSVSNGYCNTSHHTATHCNTRRKDDCSHLCAQLKQLQEGPLPVRVHPIVETPDVLLNSKQLSAHIWMRHVTHIKFSWDSNDEYSLERAFNLPRFERLFYQKALQI